MKVLLLEDDPELGSAVLDGLRDDGFTVDPVADLAAADEQLAVSVYDCAVFDRMLPDGDSLVLVEALRARGDSTPVLMLTARDRVSDRVAGFEHGADDYLVKPFAYAELVVRIRALGRRRDELGPSIRRVGDLELDVVRHRVTRDGVLLSLTAKEFSVLEVLTERPGAVVTRAELLERCWDEASAPGSNIVDVLIGQLRRRLGEPDPIVTVRGVGYRTVDDADDAAAGRSG